MSDEGLDQVRQWSEKIGLLTPLNVPLTIELISKSCESANTIPIEQVEELLLKVSAYNLYLKSLKGSILAKLTNCESKIKRRLFISITKVGDTQYKTKEEKESMAADIDGELAALLDEQMVLKMKIFKIKDVPYAIDSIIDTMKMVYQKRLSNVPKDK